MRLENILWCFTTHKVLFIQSFLSLCELGSLYPLAGGPGTGQSCVTLTPQGWVRSHTLQLARQRHSGWASPRGTVLLGSYTSNTSLPYNRQPTQAEVTSELLATFSNKASWDVQAQNHKDYNQ